MVLSSFQRELSEKLVRAELADMHFCTFSFFSAWNADVKLEVRLPSCNHEAMSTKTKVSFKRRLMQRNRGSLGL